MAQLYLKVEPGSDAFGIDCSGTYPLISLESEASQGCANRELMERLSDMLGEEIGIVSGHRSRRKKIAVDMVKEDVLQKLCGGRNTR